MRWRQDAKTGKLVPIDASAAKRDGGFIHANNMEAFVSPVDGTLVRNKREYDEHNKRNNVVNAAEFTPEFYASKEKERARFYNGEHTSREKQARKEQMYENIIRLERQG